MGAFKFAFAELLVPDASAVNLLKTEFETRTLPFLPAPTPILKGKFLMLGM